MAGLSDAATDRVTLGSAPSMSSLTIAGWAKIGAASGGSFNPMCRFHTLSGDATSWIVGFKGTNGRTPAVYSPSNTAGISAAEQALNTYVFVMATLSGTAATLSYTNTPGGTLTTVSGTVAAAGTPDRLTFFGRSAADGSEWLSGTLSHWRVWLAVLTALEGKAESGSDTPVRSANLWANWKMGDNGSGGVSLVDTVAARNLVAGSTALTLASGPSFGQSFTLSTVDQAVAPTTPTRSRGRTLLLNTQTASGAAPARSRGRTAGPVTQTATGSTPARNRGRTAGPVVQTAAPSAPARTRSRTLAVTDTTAAPQPLTRSRGRVLGVTDQTSVAAAPIRTRAVALALAVTSAAVQLPGRVRARVLGVVDGAAAVLLPTRTRARTTPTVDQQAVPSTPARGNSQQFVLPVVVQATSPIAPSRQRAAELGLVLQSTLVLPLDTEAGPWPPHRGPGQPVEPVRVGPGRSMPQLAAGPGNTQPEIVVGDGVVP